MAVEVKQLVPVGGLSTDARKTKHYKQENFEWYYEEGTLRDLLKESNGEWTEQSEKLHQAYVQAVEGTTKRHKWTWVEDEFIKSNYHYLSDNVIGLALNIPGRFVKLRRLSLGLKKGTNKDTYKVVIWCERQDYEEDLKRFKLNGTLPTKDRITKGCQDVY